MPEGGPQNNPPKQEGLNIKPFSTDFVKAQIEQLLGSVELIKTVGPVEVAINPHNQMRLNVSVTAFGANIKVKATLENSANSLKIIGKPDIDANFLVKPLASGAINPYLDKVPELLKDYIEKTENQKVQKIEIKNGQLEVTFEKKKQEITEAGSNKEEVEENKDDQRPSELSSFELGLNRAKKKLNVLLNIMHNKDAFVLIKEGVGLEMPMYRHPETITHNGITYKIEIKQGHLYFYDSNQRSDMENPDFITTGLYLKKFFSGADFIESAEEEIKSYEKDIESLKQKNIKKEPAEKQEQTYKSTLKYHKGRGYFNSANQLVYYETPQTLMIDGYEFTFNTPTNLVIGGDNGYITFHDGSRFDYKTEKLSLAHNDGSTEIKFRKLTEKELDEVRQNKINLKQKVERAAREAREEGKFSTLNLKVDDKFYKVEYNFSARMTAGQDNPVIIFKDVAIVNVMTGEIQKGKDWKEGYEVRISQGENNSADKTKETKTTKPATKKNIEPPKKPAEKPEPRAETLPPGVFSAEYIKDIVFDLLEEEGKTPESYEIIKDEKGIQTFVLKFTDGTTNEHSVRGVLGLRLRVPIFDLEGIEPVDGGKNFRLVWKEDVGNEVAERPKSEKEIELAKLLEREQEIDAFREALLKKLEEIERKKKK